MSPRGRRLVLAMVVVGVAVRVFFAFAFRGDDFDMTSFDVVRRLLESDPLGLYQHMAKASRWPYAPGFLPWVRVADLFSTHVGGSFYGLVKLPAIVADMGIAVLVQAFLARRGADERTRLVAFGLVVLGPSFAIISGYHGQIDSVAFFWAVAALVVWEAEGEGRAWQAGLLLGVGGAIKTLPLLLVVAMLPSVRRPREFVVLCMSAGAVVVITLVPFALRDLDALRVLSRYTGLPGQGGLSLAAQPELANYVARQPVAYNSLEQALIDARQVINLGWLLLAASFVWARKVRAPEAAVILWLAAYVFGTGFFFQYLVWGLPFMLMAGRLRLVVAIQATVLVPSVIWYLAPWDSTKVVAPYAALMIALWLGLIGALAHAVWRERQLPIAAA